mmetsp:Transcript_13897/g.20991  ORF Transcript_13897/g.20991 Transcript_13897/m.20991 type:complete len:137 (-) Transcript_13897:79-489(-)
MKSPSPRSIHRTNPNSKATKKDSSSFDHSRVESGKFSRNGGSSLTSIQKSSFKGAYTPTKAFIRIDRLIAGSFIIGVFAGTASIFQSVNQIQSKQSYSENVDEESVNYMFLEDAIPWMGILSSIYFMYYSYKNGRK